VWQFEQQVLLIRTVLEDFYSIVQLKALIDTRAINNNETGGSRTREIGDRAIDSVDHRVSGGEDGGAEQGGKTVKKKILQR
jgi:hypothetical protein